MISCEKLPYSIHRLFSAIIFLAPFILVAQTAGQYTFTGPGFVGKANPFIYNGVTLHSVTASSLVRSANLSAYGWSNMYLAENWPTGASNTPNLFNTPAQLTGSIDLTKYFEFTLSAATGKTFSNPTVYFNLRRFDKGPQQWSWRSSLDNYASDLPLSVVGGTSSTVMHSAGVITLADVGTVTGFELKVDAQNLTTITFRLYGYNAESASGADGGRAGFETKFNFSVDNTYDAGGWSLGSRPLAGEHIYIADNFVVAPDSAYDVLRIEVAPSKTLTLNADATGYGQLKVAGTITNNGTITANQYISSTGHHGISSPMTGGFGTTSGTSSTLYGYDAANGAYLSAANTTVTTAGAGYFAPVGTGGYLTAAGTFSTTGTPNTSHTHSLGYATSVATGGSGNGWNLIGNPYTCGLDWTGVTKTNVNDAFYIWDAATSTYKYYVNGVSAPTGTYAGSALASGVIPPMQAFWVQATASGASVVSTMASHGTVASSPTFYKTQPDNIILTVSNLSDAAKGDVLWVKNVYGTTNIFEGEEDAWKMTNYGGYPNIYTYDNGQKMAINATDLMQTGIIPVGMSAPVPGVKYVFHAEQVTSNGAYSVILEDKLLNTFTDLDQEGYTFTYGAWSQEGPRFALHINQATVGQEEQSVLSEVKLFQNGDRLIIHGDAAMHTSYSILTLDGRLITEGFLQAGMASVMAPKAGLYIVQLNGQQASVGRVMIQ